MRRLFSLIATAFLIVLAVPIFAQEQTASIEGMITDQTGAALPGVTVEAVSPNGQRFSTQSDKEGHYRFPSVPPGVYTVTGTLAGLQTAVLRKVDVNLGQSAKADLSLRTRMAEQITVTAEAPIVDVTSSAAASSIRVETIEKLPRGRDFASVVVQAAAANQNNRAGGIMIDGASGAENRYIMDGVDTTNPQTGVQGKTLATDFVEEVQVKSSGYAAEFGGATGGVINVITKSGTNEFKGSAGGYYNDRSWGGAVRPTLQTQLTNSTAFEQFMPRKDKFTDAEPSFTLGGPVWKDRLWFYGGYNPWIQKTTRTVDFLNSNGSVRTTQSFGENFRRQNYVGTLSGSGGSKLIYRGTYNSSGYKDKGTLPLTSGRGSETANYGITTTFTNWTGSGYADFVASPQWFFSTRGGRFYRNTHEDGVSTDIRLIFNTGSPGATINGARVFPEIPDNLIRPSGFSNIPTNSSVGKDAYTTDNFNIDGSWFPEFAGTHRVKAGVQINNIKNEVFRGAQNYSAFIDWNGTCGFCSTRGKYGSAAVYAIRTEGNVQSKNTGLFVQDSWTTMQDRLTLNIGVRTEQERVPAYNFGQGVNVTGKYAIRFDYRDKLAPRLGFAYDVLGNGRTKAYGSYGKFYDVTKMEMPRGSFGGDKWIYWPFSLDTFDWTQLDKCTNVTNNPTVRPSCPGMTLQGGGVDLRGQSNNAEHPLIDPNLKPMEQREVAFGFQQELTPTMAAGFRYVNKHLARAIEDVGVHVFLEGGSESEQFFIANPGEGVATTILAATGCTTCPAMPKAKRDYNGFEFEFTKRFVKNWSTHFSYVYSTLKGNYSGLANSDESAATGNARTSPNVNRVFDSLFMLYDQTGTRQVEGKLGGDRPHQAKAQVAYQFPFGTTLGVNEYYYSGVLGTTEMRFQGAPFFAFNRGDLGRTPNITQTDLNIQHDLHLGRYGVSIGAIVLNLFDQKGVMNVDPRWSTTSILLRDLSACGSGDVSVAACGPSANTPVIGGATSSAARNLAQAQAFFKGFDAKRQRDRQVALGLIPSPLYNQPNAYQDPREVRVFVRLIF
ncbi:MAG: carboxypeptidase regulatory-like domain-containing protein [Acidobacteriota bacterium]|nr:carboxypeptidase regulatory-like domain-containing protein [Acidobacteriota bacterium]